MFSVITLFSIFYIFLCFLVLISFWRQMIVFSLLFGELWHCHFCRYSLKQSSSTTCNNITEKDQQFKRTMVFCILYPIPFVLMCFLHSFMLREFSFLL